MASRDIIIARAQNDKPRYLPSPPNLKPGVSPVVQVIVDLRSTSMKLYNTPYDVITYIRQ